MSITSDQIVEQSALYTTPVLLRERLRELDGWISGNRSQIANYARVLPLDPHTYEATLDEMISIAQQIPEVQRARVVIEQRLVFTEAQAQEISA